MKHFLKGVASAAIVIIVLMVISVLCNMRGININSAPTGVVSALCAMWIYRAWIRNEKEKE